MREWFGAGIVAAGMGSKLITNDLLKAGDWKGIEARVRKTVLCQMYAGADRIEPQAAGRHFDARLVLRGWNHHLTSDLAVG